MTDHSGHATEQIKDYDVLRCVHCDAVIKVPHEALEFKCPYCDGINEFEVVSEDASEN